MLLAPFSRFGTLPNDRLPKSSKLVSVWFCASSPPNISIFSFSFNSFNSFKSSGILLSSFIILFLLILSFIILILSFIILSFINSLILSFIILILSFIILILFFIILSFTILPKFFIHFNTIVFGIFSNLSILPSANCGRPTSYRL